MPPPENASPVVSADAPSACRSLSDRPTALRRAESHARSARSTEIEGPSVDLRRHRAALRMSKQLDGVNDPGVVGSSRCTFRYSMMA